MEHLDESIFCGLDTETTGFDPNTNEIIELALVPTDTRFQLIHTPLHLYIRPTNFESIDLEAIKIQSISKQDPKANKYKNKLVMVTDRGIDKTQVASIVYNWFEGMRLGTKSRLIPIGANLEFDISFLKILLGPGAYYGLFDTRFRDIGIIASSINDKYMLRNDAPPFRYTNQPFLTKAFNLQEEGRVAHNAIDDAVTAIKIYRGLLTY